MCRNIKPLFNFDLPATEEEIKNASLQFIRKISGFIKPSQVNEKVFEESTEKIAEIIKELLDSLKTTTGKKNREEDLKRKERYEKRFGVKLVQ